jgi:S-adenosylmethionine:tRNA-ribosyltransferase-isomerase (queuine synthetase)
MKKIMFSIILFLLLIASGCGINNFDNYKISQLESAALHLESIETLEKNSEYIVEAKFTGKREVEEWYDSQGDLITKNSRSTIKLTKVFKGNGIKAGDEIEMIEPVSFENGTFETLLGYVPMNENGKYILFLSKHGKKDVFTIMNTEFAKYDLNKEEKAKIDKKVRTFGDVKKKEYFGENVEKFNNFKEKVKEKYIRGV